MNLLPMQDFLLGSSQDSKIGYLHLLLITVLIAALLGEEARASLFKCAAVQWNSAPFVYRPSARKMDMTKTDLHVWSHRWFGPINQCQITFPMQRYTYIITHTHTEKNFILRRCQHRRVWRTSTDMWGARDNLCVAQEQRCVWLTSTDVCGSRALTCVAHEHWRVWLTSTDVCGSRAQTCVAHKHRHVWLTSTCAHSSDVCGSQHRRVWLTSTCMAHKHLCGSRARVWLPINVHQAQLHQPPHCKSSGARLKLNLLIGNHLTHQLDHTHLSHAHYVQKRKHWLCLFLQEGGRNRWEKGGGEQDAVANQPPM